MICASVRFAVAASSTGISSSSSVLLRRASSGSDSTKTAPVRAGSNAGARNTFGRTVPICGFVSGQILVAIRLPPKAGRVQSTQRCASTSRCVQSAVSPVCSRQEMRGPRSRPTFVAPIMSTSGAYLRTRWHMAAVKMSVL